MDGTRCPCGSGDAYRACCGPALRGEAPALTAEALMRSRYTAFVRGDARYLLETWHPSTRPATLALDDTQWRGLDVLRAVRGLTGDDAGVVEFVAHFEEQGRALTMREASNFVREGGAWFYVDGEVGDK